MDTSSRYFRIQKRDIAYFKFIIESHEGMAVVRTHDAGEAVVELMIAPGWEEDLEAVLSNLKKEIGIEPLPSSFETQKSEFQTQTLDHHIQRSPGEER